MRKRISVDKLHRPVQQADDTLQTTKCNRGHDVPLLSLLLLCNTHSLAYHIDQRHDQRAKTDTAKRVRHRSAESASCRPTGHTAGLAGHEEPGTIDAGDDAVDGVLQPLGDPVAGEGDEDNKPDDFGRGACTSAATGRASGVGAAAAAGFVFDVYRYKSDGEPCAERNGNEAADCAYEEDVAEGFGYVHCLLQNDNAKGDSRNPADETDDAEDTENGEDDGGGVVMAVEIVDACSDAEHDVQDAGDPDELLGEGSSGGEISP